ncbi:MAG: sel1 repeat family protein [Clostridia bacterium]|nr:sel1 repeat family protein [Clostridia bacterium]
MYTLEHLADMIISINNNDGKFSLKDLENWYFKYSDKIIHCYYPKSNDISVDRILKNDLFYNVARSLGYLFEELIDLDFKKLANDLQRLLDILRLDVLERDYTDNEKSLILITLFDENKISSLTENEVTLYRNLALELAEKDVREGLIAVGYGSYGGDEVFACDYSLSEKCMLKLLDTVEKLPEKGFYANTLGYIYYYGRTNGGAPDYDKAYKYFSFGASLGIYESIYKLSDLYLYGYGGFKSPASAKALLMRIYDDLYKSFLDGNYNCEFADVALRLGKIVMNENREGFPLYASGLNYLLEAKYALSLRDKFGDDGVKARLNDTIEDLKSKMDFELQDEMEICSLDYILWKNSGRDMVGTIKKIGEHRYNLNVKMKPNEDNVGKLFICCYDLDLCGLYDEINVTIDAFGEVSEGAFEFNDVSYKDFMLGDGVAYRLPHNTSFIISKKMVE